MYYYSTIRLILICRPSEGGRLSRPRHCSQCAARAQSCESQWFSCKNTSFFSAARFDPGTSRAARKRATTRPLRPAWVLYVLSMCAADVFCCAEVDSFGHFFMKAKTRVADNSLEPSWDAVRPTCSDGSSIFESGGFSGRMTAYQSRRHL